MSQSKPKNSPLLYNVKPAKSSVSATLPNQEQVDKLGMLALKCGYTVEQFNAVISPKYGPFTLVDARKLSLYLQEMEADNE